MCTHECKDMHLAHAGGSQPQSPVVGRQGMGLGWPGEKTHAQSEVGQAEMRAQWDQIFCFLPPATHTTH